MEQIILKLEREYLRKIQTCDESLENILEQNRIARRNGDEELMQIYREERKEWDARRAAYIQAKVDIVSLLDGLEV